MDKLLSVSAIALAMAISAGSALAADLPSRKAPPVAPPPPPLWTGFYAGLNVGYGWGADANVGVATTQAYDFFGFNSQRSLFGRGSPRPFDPNAGLSAASASGMANVKDGGVIGGGQLGYNYQFGGEWLIGAEADIQGADISGENSFAGGAAWNVFNITRVFRRTTINSQFNRSAATATDVAKHTDWLGTVRARVGWLVIPDLLVYGTGGLAYGGVEARVDQKQLINNTLSLTVGANTAVGNSAAAAFGATRYSDTRVGWTAGGGLEFMFLRNWSLKTEALYYDLGAATFATSPLVSAGPAVGLPGAAAIFRGTVNDGATRVRYDGVIARAGLNYHFDWRSVPAVARF
jgi:outer membrane immunogenic protein